MKNPLLDADELFGEKIKRYAPLDVKIEEPEKNEDYVPKIDVKLDNGMASKFRLSGGKPFITSALELINNKSIKKLDEELNKYKHALSNFIY
jgi:hypothetical protein